jgi:predicted ATP-grasp superfamily ATP-dependent carboligase
MEERSTGRVLVFGDDMRIFLAVVRSLGRSGKEVHAVPFNWHAPALRSRYIAATHRLPRYSDDPQAWVIEVLRLLREQHFDLVVPCCDDRSILPFHHHREEFAALGVRIAIPGSQAMALLFDKAQTRDLCSRLGIPVTPGTRLKVADTARSLSGRFGFPLVIKPARSYSLDRLDAWGKVHIVSSEAELDHLLHTIDEPECYLVEQYFEGAGVGVSVLSDRGRVLNAFQHRRLREGWGGSSSHRISEQLNPELLAACEDIAAATQLTGVCMFEFRYNMQSKHWILLETNARFWGSSPLPISLGIDFPRYLYDLLVHGSTHPQVLYPVGITSRNIVLDVHNLVADLKRRKGRATGTLLHALASFVVQPLLWMSGRERSDSFVRDDLSPAFAECGQLFRTIAEHRRWRRSGKLERRRGAQAA